MASIPNKQILQAFLFPLFQARLKSFRSFFCSYKKFCIKFQYHSACNDRNRFDRRIFAPIGRISRWLEGSSSQSHLLHNSADIGKAEIPAAPTIGLIFCFVKRFSNFANTTPPIVSNMNATKPMSMINKVSVATKYSARMEKVIVIPNNRVIKLAKSCGRCFG